MSSPKRNHRLARELYEQAGQACAFTICCGSGRAPFTDARYARIAVDCLLQQQAKSSCHLFVYCVMPNHVHLIVSPDAAGSSTLTYVDRYKGWTGRELRLAGWHGDLWQPRSYDIWCAVTKIC